MKVTLTKTEAVLVFRAMGFAIQDRDGLAHAYKGRGPIALAAQKDVARIKKLRKKLAPLVGISEVNELEKLCSEAELVDPRSLFKKESKK